MKVIKVLSLVVQMLLLGGGLAEEPLVNTKNGWLRGNYTSTRNGRQVVEFLGIPYANPPTGSLRFKEPEPMQAWDGVRNATTECSACIQQLTMFEVTKSVVSGAEDCLCLNVFTPQLTPDEMLPVIVFIHGGAFMGFSSDSTMYGPLLLLDQDVILVTFNYRLGVMGFAATTDGTISGNAGMKDQVLALKWVKDNIEMFGGDVSRITLMGESAGAVSVNLHMYSSLSQDLFTRAIIQSGSAFVPWAVTDAKVLEDRTFQLAEKVSCSSSNSANMLQCLQETSAVDIVNQTQKLIVWDVDPLTLWGPTVETFDTAGAFLTKHPRESEQHLTIPMLAGFNNAEGAFKTYTMTSGDVEGKFTQWNENFDDVTAISLMYNYTASNPTEVTQAVRNYYFGADVETIDTSMTTQITNLYSDRWFLSGTLEAVEAHEGSTFLYYFNRNSSLSIVGAGFTGSTEYYGACHADDLMYFFSMNGIAATVSQLDDGYLQASQQLIELWTLFAKNGNPSNENILWEPVDTESTNHLEINREGVVMKDSLNDDIQERVNFWKTLSLTDTEKSETCNLSIFCWTKVLGDLLSSD